VSVVVKVPPKAFSVAVNVCEAVPFASRLNERMDGEAANPFGPGVGVATGDGDGVGVGDATAFDDAVGVGTGEAVALALEVGPGVACVWIFMSPTSSGVDDKCVTDFAGALGVSR
jgi:hypothetical protein